MNVSFTALIEYWRARLLRIESLLARKSRFSWGLRLERRVISYCLHRYSDGPNASPPAEAAPLDAAGAERARKLWVREEPPSTPAPPMESVKPDAPQRTITVEEVATNPISYPAIAAVLFVLGLIILIFVLEPM
jgi:hypothetical protein